MSVAIVTVYIFKITAAKEWFLPPVIIPKSTLFDLEFSSSSVPLVFTVNWRHSIVRDNRKPREGAVFVLMFSYHIKEGGSHWMCLPMMLRGSQRPLHFPFSLLHCDISKNFTHFKTRTHMLPLRTLIQDQIPQALWCRALLLMLLLFFYSLL